MKSDTKSIVESTAYLQIGDEFCPTCGRRKGSISISEKSLDEVIEMGQQQTALLDELERLVVYVPGQIGDNARALLRAHKRL